MQANPRKKAFICFHFLCQIGAFQWVTANPNKKFPSSISGSRNAPIARRPPHCGNVAFQAGGE
jgi:hypothetical protein